MTNPRPCDPISIKDHVHYDNINQILTLLQEVVVLLVLVAELVHLEEGAEGGGHPAARLELLQYGRLVGQLDEQAGRLLLRSLKLVSDVLDLLLHVLSVLTGHV